MGTRQVVAVTKYAVPGTALGTIPRPDLVRRLDDAIDTRLTVVSAPPGSGKSTLLVEWVRQLPGPVMWMACDATDADPRRFWESLALGLRRVWPSVGLDIDELLDDPRHDDVAITLANDLAAVDESGVVVIDDFHLARPQTSAMSAFIRAVPDRIRLVLGTRTDPVVPLARLRVQGQLCEIRQHDLRLSTSEVGRVLDEFGVRPSDDELAELSELTEGWTAGVVLAALYLQSRSSARDLLEGMVTTDRSLVDFLVNEVVDVQPQDVIDFLMTTAELEAFDVGLCTAVTDLPDCADRIRDVRARNLFLVELDADSGSYRYHHLFERFLRARLRAVAPARVVAIHRAAAAAYEARGDSPNAVRHSMSAGDTDAALRVLSRHGAAASTPGDAMAVATARAWLREHGQWHRKDDSLGVLYCVLTLNAANASDVDLKWWLSQVEADEAELDAESRCILHGAWSFVELHGGDPVAALDRARRAEAIRIEHSVTNSWAFLVMNLGVQALLWLDDLDGAERALRAAVTGAPRPPVIGQVRVPAFGAYVAFLAGELDRAEQLANEAAEGAERLGFDRQNFGLAEPALARAGLAMERNRLDEAEFFLEEVLQIAEQGRRPPTELLAQLEMARLMAAHGDAVAVAVRLERARAVIAGASAPVVARIDQTEVRLALQLGDVAAGAAVWARLPDTTVARLLRARLALAQDDPTSALAVVAGPDELWPTRRLRIERHVVTALALGHLEPGAAQDHLRRALTLGEPVGFQQTFVTEGPLMWKLLEALPATGRLAEYVGGLLAVAFGTPPTGRAGRRDDLVEQLSEREVTVLRYLASRLPAPEIATTLFISGNTVRSHVKAIYRKLGVNSRAEAVARGRRLGLLPA